MKETIDELTREIVRVCARCPHMTYISGHMECDRKKSQCHSKRVRKWLDEIKKLEQA